MAKNVTEYLDSLEAYYDDGDVPRLCEMLREAVVKLERIGGKGEGLAYHTWYETLALETLTELDRMAQEAGE